MYVPSHFESRNDAALAALIDAHPLAQIVHRGADGGLDADPVPLLHDAATRTLRGHVARANPLWRVAAGQPVLAIFTGADAYVSPNWYPSKAATHKAVPTWNYLVVHAHGTLQVHDDADWLRAFLTQLTARHEASLPRPWSLADAPADYLGQMLRAIVGIEIPVARLVGKFKASQNRSAADREGVARGLGDRAAMLVADPPA
ncbi:MAG: FMN-binding negative transcriptional regulator [Rubrivivax sp.]|nr:FMN-binding negative transcriptional regulator [Rubrivivax sp.]